MTDEPFLLVKGAAGLGNRILALLTAILYGKLSGRRIAVDWSDPVYSDGNRNAFPGYFSLPGSVPPESIPEEADVAPAVWRGELRRPVREVLRRHAGRRWREIRAWRRFRIDLGRLDHPEPVALFWSYYERIDSLRPHLRGDFAPMRRMKTKEILRAVLAENLEPAPPLRERVDRIRSAWPEGRRIGVHIRFTDKRCRIGAILRKLDRLAREDPDAAIFLATDSREAERIVRERHPRVLATEKWLPSRDAPLHLQDDRPDRFESGAEALVDLYLLAGCDVLVHDEGSSFAYVASLLAGGGGRVVHDVNLARHIPPRLRHRLWAMRYTWRISRRLWP